MDTMSAANKLFLISFWYLLPSIYGLARLCSIMSIPLSKSLGLGLGLGVWCLLAYFIGLWRAKTRERRKQLPYDIGSDKVYGGEVAEYAELKEESRRQSQLRGHL